MKGRGSLTAGKKLPCAANGTGQELMLFINRAP
jgi:hypothetical protein